MFQDPAEVAKLEVTHPVKQRLCNVCGFAASNNCAACKQISYCSKDHQVMDWKYGGHKAVCKNKQKNAAKNPFTLNEFELVRNG